MRHTEPPEERSALARVAGKAGRHLRTSTILLWVVAIICVATSILVQRASSANSKNFVDNPSVHLINVSGREVDTHVEPLRVQDLTVIDKLTRATPGTIVSGRYSLGIGLESQARPVEIAGMDPAMSQVLGLATMRDDVLYTVGGAAGTHTLDIPVVTSSTSAGGVSQKLAHQSYFWSPGVDRGKAEFLDGSRSASIAYVTSKTFWSVAETMFSSTQSEIVAHAQNGELATSSLVAAAYVYVPSLDGVRQTATQLEGEGYAVSYALQAFDDVEATLHRQALLGWSSLALLLMATSGYFIITWRSFMRLSRHDVGTLLHWRVPPRKIRDIYQRRVTRSATSLLVFATVAHLIGTAVLVSPSAALRSTGILLLIGVPLAIVLCLAVSRLAISPVLRENPLTLLKQGREFQ